MSIYELFPFRGYKGSEKKWDGQEMEREISWGMYEMQEGRAK